MLVYEVSGLRLSQFEWYRGFLMDKFVSDAGNCIWGFFYAQARVWKFAADAACGPRGE